MIGLTFKTRRISRSVWKAIWRQHRIINRESLLAQRDAFVFGTSFVHVGTDVADLIRRVPPWDVIISADGTPELRP